MSSGSGGKFWKTTIPTSAISNNISDEELRQILESEDISGDSLPPQYFVTINPPFREDGVELPSQPHPLETLAATSSAGSSAPPSGLPSSDQTVAMMTTTAGDHQQQQQLTRPRKRKTLTFYQIRVLNRVMERTAYPSRELRDRIATYLQIPQRNIQVWFQNQRQKSKERGRARSQAIASGPEMIPGANTTKTASNSTIAPPPQPIVTLTTGASPSVAKSKATSHLGVAGSIISTSAVTEKATSPNTATTTAATTRRSSVVATTPVPVESQTHQPSSHPSLSRHPSQLLVPRQMTPRQYRDYDSAQMPRQLCGDNDNFDNNSSSNKNNNNSNTTSTGCSSNTKDLGTIYRGSPQVGSLPQPQPPLYLSPPPDLACHNYSGADNNYYQHSLPRPHIPVTKAPTKISSLLNPSPAAAEIGQESTPSLVLSISALSFASPVTPSPLSSLPCSGLTTAPLALQPSRRLSDAATAGTLQHLSPMPRTSIAPLPPISIIAASPPTASRKGSRARPLSLRHSSSISGTAIAHSTDCRDATTVLPGIKAFTSRPSSSPSPMTTQYPPLHSSTRLTPAALPHPVPHHNLPQQLSRSRSLKRRSVDVAALGHSATSSESPKKRMHWRPWDESHGASQA